MNKGFEKLEIDEEFKTLIHPLKKNEYRQLELNLKIDGCREPIIAWNNTIVDGHNRYEICNKFHIPYAVHHVFFDSREDALIWICANQLGRRNITEETRHYLIGKQYELEKMIQKGHNTRGSNQYKKRNTPYRESFSRTAQKIGSDYNISTGSVQKYAIYSKAMDTISKADPKLSTRVLSGKCKISHENIVALSRMDPQDIRKFGEKQGSELCVFKGYSITRRDLPSAKVKAPPPVNKEAEYIPPIKVMPVRDPDAEITGLILTVPSWVSSMERARDQSNIKEISSGAVNKLEDVLLSLQKEISSMLEYIRRGQ